MKNLVLGAVHDKNKCHRNKAVQCKPFATWWIEVFTYIVGRRVDRNGGDYLQTSVCVNGMNLKLGDTEHETVA